MRLIRTEADYEAALARVMELMDASKGTPEGEELDVLVDLVETYEDKYFPMAHPEPAAEIESQLVGTGKVRQQFEEDGRDG